MGKDSSIIRISGKTYEQLKALSGNTNTKISELATKLIDIGLRHVEVHEETVVRKILVFKE